METLNLYHLQVGTADAGIEETLLSEGQRGLADYESDGSDSHDVEAALPPDFEARIRQGLAPAIHPTLTVT